MFSVLCAPGCLTVKGAGPCRPDIAAEHDVPATMLQLPCQVPAGSFLRLRGACVALLFDVAAGAAGAVRLVGAIGLVVVSGLLAPGCCTVVAAGGKGGGLAAVLAPSPVGLPVAFSLGKTLPVAAAAVACTGLGEAGTALPVGNAPKLPVSGAAFEGRLVWGLGLTPPWPTVKTAPATVLLGLLDTAACAAAGFDAAAVAARGCPSGGVLKAAGCCSPAVSKLGTSGSSSSLSGSA